MLVLSAFLCWKVVFVASEQNEQRNLPNNACGIETQTNIGQFPSENWI